MASSSSRGKEIATPSSSSEPQPKRQRLELDSISWNHEVFLSFRGEDTRKSFVDHLYTALVQQGIYTYKDDETLARGESIGPALLKAIKESRIAVIVFSKNYADSSWCLDELAHIMECMENRGQIVMPVFYDVEPSDVRKQNEKYGEAFEKHERENKQKVEIWRKALVKAGNLSGWETRKVANGHEAKCIEDIVGKISRRLSQLETSVTKDLVGIETRLQDLKLKLDIGSGGVKMVGIWGVGGGGKTTLASAAYMEISHQFDGHCLLQNIREESCKNGLESLQEKVLLHILGTNVVVRSEIEGRHMIKRRLCHKSVLIILDDVDDLKQLEALAGSRDWFGDGSRIIITTRDEHLLSRKADAIYEVSLLSHDEAIKLFDRHAKRENKPIEDYEKLSLDVVSYADGLPLALEIIGSFLYDKDKDEWMSALAKLKCIPHVKVTERLKISYDGLEPSEKELFLDIACFLRRWPRDQAMRILDACSFHPGIGVRVLIQKSLIKISNDEFIGCDVFDMHDLVQEMAHYIVRGGEPPHPLEKISRIWQEKDIVELCAMGAGTLMENNHINEVIALPSYALESVLFPSLRIPLPRYVSHPSLPDIVANMKKLRWIYWYEYPASSFPTHFQPTNLRCLILIRGQQKQLWQGRKDLPNLKILDLSYSPNLMRTPDFNGLPCLERLILEDCKKLTEIHPSIGYHERLVLVNMNGCSELKTFPPIMRMKKLETLNLSWCRNLQKFPDIQTSLDSLANLHLSGTYIEIIPSSVGQFCTNLVSFDLICCSDLKRIEGNFRLLKRLKVFHLTGYSIEKLAWDFFDKECCLEVLSLTIQTELDWDLNISPSHPIKLPQLPRVLIKLDLSWCYLEDGDIPPDICELLNLQVLNLSQNNFSRLPSSLSQIPSLKLLDLSWCECLVELTDLPSSIAVLKADYCYSLETIGDLSNYKWLWKVSLRESYKLIGPERVLHSMLQVNAVEDRFMSVRPGPSCTIRTPSDGPMKSITLQLPQNWYNDYSGFLLCDHDTKWYCVIVLKQGMSCMDSQPVHLEEFDKNLDSYYQYPQVGYVPFGSLRHASWWNPTHTNISVEIHAGVIPKVVFVRRESKKGDSKERAIDCSESWDKENKDMKTFEITDDPKSSKLKIVWYYS